MMRKKLAAIALAGTLGLTGAAGAALLVPAASYAATGDSTALTERVTSLKEALAGLVTDGTITQAQADKVATLLAESGPGFGGRGPGGHGPGLEAAAEALGMTPDELRSAAQAGRTLADLAEEKGVAEGALVDAMVAAAKEHLAEEVAEGDLTQAQADERAADLETRITERLDQPLRAGRGGHGPHRHHDDGESGEATASPSATNSSTA